MGQTSLLASVVDEHDGAINKATIIFQGNTYITDNLGKINIDNLSEGLHPISVHVDDYLPLQDTIEILANYQNKYTFTLFSQDNKLEDVTIYAKSKEQILREAPIKTVVVDTRAVIDRPNTLSELMNQSAGIRIRQSGGLGNNVDIAINGFQGNAVQYFRDGIPLEYLGGAFNINNVPINLLQRVEIYKGVIPVSLGADALGGAVNLVSNTQMTNHVNLSYSYGSFNTHTANVSGYFSNPKNGLFAGGHFFYNYADNDYKVDVNVTDPITANPIPVNVPLFHNHFKQHYGEIYFGIKNKPWADELKFTLHQYKIDRASQHPALMTVPYGAVMMYNVGWVGSIRYKKKIWNDQLSIDQFITYSHINRSRVDTLKGTYDWFGNFTPRLSGIGESPRPSHSDIDFRNIVSRTNLTFRANEQHLFDLNVVFNSNHRLGSDPYGLTIKGTDIDVLSKIALYNKFITGASWESKWLNHKLTNQLLIKYFHYHTKGINGFLDNNSAIEDYVMTASSHWGFGDAVKYQLNNRSFIRASAELTYRLPNQLELFGDNDTRAPNFDLQPEKSLNINLGYHYAADKWQIELNTYYRNTRGMILLVPIQPPFSQHMNLDSVRGYGMDIDFSYQILPQLHIASNLTWQENRMINISSPIYKWQEGTRLRNTPFFFGNINLNGTFNNIVKKDDILKPYIHYNYIREFYLNPIPKDKEPNGFLGIFGKSGVPVTNLIPDQHLLNIGTSYTPASKRYNIGAEVKNILDAKLYDYYKIQRPGRSFFIKFNYFIQFNSTNKS